MFGWTPRTQPARRACEQSGAGDGGLFLQTSGLVAGTVVASALGWRAVEALAVGDGVLTFDNGMQRIEEVHRLHLWPDAARSAPASWPVVVPEGALGNRTALTLLPDQGVMIESDTACEVFGDPFAVVPAQSLVGVRGIDRRAPTGPVELVALVFAEPQVIHAGGGALIHCPPSRRTLDRFIEAPVEPYEMLSARDAGYLAECLVAEDRLRGGWGAHG